MSSRRRVIGVRPMGSGADFHYKSEAQYLKMMDRLRYIDRNDPIMGQGITGLIDIVLQDGLTVDPKTDDERRTEKTLTPLGTTETRRAVEDFQRMHIARQTAAWTRIRSGIARRMACWWTGNWCDMPGAGGRAPGVPGRRRTSGRRPRANFLSAGRGGLASRLTEHHCPASK